MTKQNIITSYRGPKGGVAFARPIDSITLFEIVKSIDGEKLFDNCILGLINCSDDNPCPLHNQAAQAKNQLKITLQNTTVYELANQVNDLNLRLEN